MQKLPFKDFITKTAESVQGLPAILLAAVLIVFLPACKDSTARKPNIIFILTDDQRWDALGYAGNPIIRTPNMDELAASGLYFKNAFVTTTIILSLWSCTITGKIPTKPEALLTTRNTPEWSKSTILHVIPSSVN